MFELIYSLVGIFTMGFLLGSAVGFDYAWKKGFECGEMVEKSYNNFAIEKMKQSLKANKRNFKKADS